MPRSKQIIRAVVLCSIIMIAAASTALANRVYIDINAPHARQFPTAVPLLKPLSGPAGSEAAAKLIEVLTDDLDFCGLFRILDRSGFLENYRTMALTAAQTNFRAWSMIGAEFLIKGGYKLIGDQFSVEIRFFDVREGRLLAGKRYTGRPDDFRIMAHRFADEIMLQLTGQQGIFQTKIAFVSTTTGNKEIYISDFDGHDIRQITRYRSITTDPAWSPDMKYLAFMSYKDGQPYLYKMDLAKGRSQRISGRPGINITPTFSPMGDQMACCLSKTGDSELYLMTTNGQIIKQLTYSPGIDVQPCFSPDGRQIVFVSNRHGGPQLFIMNLGDGAIRRLTYQGRYNTSPSWSPRGDRIAYVSLESNQFNIFTINVAGDDVQQLTLDQGDNEHPSWSADGRMILFSSTRSGKAALYAMTANGAHVRKVVDMKGKQINPSWSGRLR